MIIHGETDKELHCPYCYSDEVVQMPGMIHGMGNIFYNIKCGRCGGEFTIHDMKATRAYLKEKQEHEEEARKNSPLGWFDRVKAWALSKG